jgi:hypothetical protein
LPGHSGVTIATNTSDNKDDGVKGQLEFLIYFDNQTAKASLGFDALMDELCKPVITLTDVDDESKQTKRSGAIVGDQTHD